MGVRVYCKHVILCNILNLFCTLLLLWHYLCLLNNRLDWETWSNPLILLLFLFFFLLSQKLNLNLNELIYKLLTKHWFLYKTYFFPAYHTLNHYFCLFCNLLLIMIFIFFFFWTFNQCVRIHFFKKLRSWWINYNPYLLNLYLFAELSIICTVYHLLDFK